MTRAGSQRPEPATSIRRRAVLLGLGAAMSPAAAWAAGDRPRRIAMLLARRPEDPEAHAFVKAFRQGLEVVGMRPGRDCELDHRWLPRDPADARANADSVLAAGAEIIVVLSTPYLRAALAATSTVPIVFVGTADPIGQGFVSELARPARNITGFAAEEPSVVGKWLGLLKEAAPQVARCTAIFNPDTAPAVPQFLASMAATGRVLGVETAGTAARTEAEIATAIARAAREPQSGLLVLPDAFMLSRRELIVRQVAQLGLPAVFYHRAFAQAGGLLAYGIDRAHQFRLAAGYVRLILNGTSLADLPVQQPTDFELSINLRAAKALGLEISPTLLASADEVIE